MEKKELFTIDAQPYRQPISVYGFCFGNEKKTLAIMGSMRGDEIQQMYIASRLVQSLKKLEEKGCIADDIGIMVVPCAGQFSMNVAKRFWPVDNTDINRMFPGYDQGETTQRLADSIFKQLQGYEWGIQLTSFYLPGDFVSHVRIMNTGYQKNEDGLAFGLPYLEIRKPHPYDTTTLNYNWQVWGTKTFSIYSKATDVVDEESAWMTVSAILRFLRERGLLHDVDLPKGENTIMFDENSLVNILTKESGIMHRLRHPGEHVSEGELLAQVLDPYTAEIREEITAPCYGNIFFARKAQIICEHEIAFRFKPDITM